MGYETLLVERGDGIATITLNRPEARNALDFAMRRELLSVLDEIEADPTSRVAILTGAGGHFCSGGDVKTMRTRHTAAEGRGRVEMLNRLVLRLVDYPLPTIAMVDGYAVGAGSNLALCCDLIVASDRAKFGELFCKIGLAVDGGGTWLLSRVVGTALDAAKITDQLRRSTPELNDAIKRAPRHPLTAPPQAAPPTGPGGAVPAPAPAPESSPAPPPAAPEAPAPAPAAPR